MIGSSNAIPQMGVVVSRNSNASITSGKWQGGYDSTKVIYLSRNDQNCQVYICPPDSNQAVCVGNSWDTSNSGGSRTFTFILPKGWFYVYFATNTYTNVIAFDTSTPKVVGNTVSVGQTYTDNGPYVHVFDFDMKGFSSNVSVGPRRVWAGDRTLAGGNTTFTYSELGLSSKNELFKVALVFKIKSVVSFFSSFTFNT